MKKATYFLFTACLSGIIWTSCQRESLPDPGASGLMELELPVGVYDFNQPGYNNSSSLKGKVINNDLATLGRVLFYDKALSVSHTIACASCHHQERAFSDGLTLSRGFMGEETARNSMAIFNMPLNGTYFWDLRRDGLKEMVLDPVQHLVEMGTESPQLLAAKLKEIPYYSELFSRAFGSDDINGDRISLALAEFISAMMSNSSRFDNRTLTPQEERGQTVFLNAQCGNCHGGRNFNNMSIFEGFAVGNRGGGWGGSNGGNTNLNIAGDFANIGLDYSYSDPGMTPEKQNEIGIAEVEQGLFKIPSLRNVALTGPYMHDGRFKTLMDVINHYDHGVKMHTNLDRRLLESVVLPNGTIEFVDKPRRLNLSQFDKEDLVAFLTALTDETLTTHPRFSNPFQTK
ncbi:MAG TPA: cytochrome-c peroxidase [Bacteroidetes bacterium]|nr:cytochrome-c peroxidase [Bacteroidota bacterium]